jgi:histidyl-tRNA synthetase
MQLTAVRGMNDILPEETARWQHLEDAFRRAAELHGYEEVRTPLIEQTALFAREIGETTDVVEKEMYSFERHGDRLTVRPEGTASAARAYVEHTVHAKQPVSRWYYLGPMFRGERPAKGRYRQFHQAGCEHYGDAGPLCDAEMVSFLVGFLQSLGIEGLAVHVSSLGSGDTRVRYREALRAFFEPKRASLSEDSQRRLEKNPLRILDSKAEKDREASVGRAVDPRFSRRRRSRALAGPARAPAGPRHRARRGHLPRARPRLLHAHPVRDPHDRGATWAHRTRWWAAVATTT